MLNIETIFSIILNLCVELVNGDSVTLLMETLSREEFIKHC